MPATPFRTTHAVLVALVLLVASGCQGSAPKPAPSLSAAVSAPGVPSTLMPSTPPAASPSPSPAPLTGRITFMRRTPDGELFDLISVNTDGSDERVVATRIGGAALSADHSLLLVANLEDGNLGTILDRNGVPLRTLKAPEGTLGLGCGSWSPDATRLLCEGWDDARPGRTGLYSVSAADGGDVRLLAASPDGKHLQSGQWTDDGAHILYVHTTDEKAELGELWQMNPDGSDAHRLMDRPVGWSYSISPDGSRIVTDLSGHLLVFDAHDLSIAPTPIEVAEDAANGNLSHAHVFGAAWSPDGTHFVLSVYSFARKNSDIVIINRDGSGLRPVTSNPSNEEGASWVPATP